jgi:hypothetical protein
MATKPTIADSRWATDGGAELTAPSSGVRDSGFVTGTPAVADHENVLHKEHYKWAQYVDEGILTGAFHLAYPITPTAITGSNDNYNPTGWSSGSAGAQVIRQDLSADATLTGLAGGSAGRIAIIRNLNASFDLKLAHDVTSTAANRFQLPEGKDLYLVGAQSFVVLQYDITLSRWVVIATNGRQPRTVWVHGARLQTSNPATDVQVIGGYGNLNNAGVAVGFYGDLGLAPGTRITAGLLYVTASATAGTRTFGIRASDLDGTDTTIAQETSSTVSSSYTITLAPDLPVTLGDFPHAVHFGARDGDIVNGAKFTVY